MAIDQVSDIQLTQSAISILKDFEKDGAFTWGNGPGQYRDKFFYSIPVIDNLVSLGLLHCTHLEHYTLTQAGRDWLDFHKSRERKFWIPIIISTIALVVSIIALINPS